MDKIKSYCLLLCDECSIFKATQRDDDEKRAELAATLSEVYDIPFKPADMNCDGCTTKGGRLFKFAHVCSVRNRGIKTQKAGHAAGPEKSSRDA